MDSGIEPELSANKIAANQLSDGLFEDMLFPTEDPINLLPPEKNITSDDEKYVSGQIISRAERDAIVEKAINQGYSSQHYNIRPAEVPEHLLKRSEARRKVLGVTQSHPETPSLIGKTLAEKLFLTGVPECSIAASDAAKLAQEKFDGLVSVAATLGESRKPVTIRKVAKKHMNLDIVGEATESRAVTANWITNPMPTTAGHNVRLGLIRNAEPTTSDKGAHPDDLTLVAELRNGLAFPLVHFSRSNKAYCDFLQFYGEDRLSELEAANLYGWSEDDSGSRFDAVLLVIDQLKEESVTDFTALTDTLKLDERIKQQIGEYNADTEAIINGMFKALPPGLIAEYQKEYSNVNTGKYPTNVTVTGKVELMTGDSSMYERKLTIRQFPTSQPEGEWPELVLQADQHGTIAFVDEHNNLSEPTPADLELIRDLLESPAKELRGEVVVSSAVNSIQKSEKDPEGVYPDTKTWRGIIIGTHTALQTSVAQILDHSLYVGAGKGILWGTGTVAANKAIIKIRKHLRKRDAMNLGLPSGGEEEEI